ncbi:hypothetical protein IWW38_004098 [Coemansia aciculifera]|uniref:Uncharacterized protein n=1 Tax=Coemansia aciculifera TaxID=417176 RepID=A0ACC1LZH8_9FUNG|nr:hypothetical protein IWW38_004098 [Coemansia aciculifera]
MRLSTIVSFLPLAVLALASNVAVTSSAVAPMHSSFHYATPAPVAPAADRHNVVPAVAPHGARQDQVQEQIPDNAIAIPAPNVDSAGNKTKPKQMMLFFPDPAEKLTPEQQHEWAQKFNKSMAEMSPKERESWMQEVVRAAQLARTCVAAAAAARAAVAVAATVAAATVATAAAAHAAAAASASI